MYMIQWLLLWGKFDPVGFGELTTDQQARLPDEYNNCMHLLTDNAVYSCGEGFEQCIAHCGTTGASIVQIARLVPLWEDIRKHGYQFIADRRSIWGKFRSCKDIKADRFSFESD
jgi:predicted DCC family thiol-disulfide oxidoreductase YuxK